MKYLRRQNLNVSNVLDDTVLQRADGNVEFNPTQKVIINGDLEFGPGAVIPGPEVTNVLYVTLDGNDDNTGRGEGAGQAKRTLKSALAAADQGATIYVRSGEYIEDNPLRIPPKVSIIGDNLRRTIIRPLNGPQSVDITYAEKTNEYVTLTTDTPHGLEVSTRIRVRVQLGTTVAAGSIITGKKYRILTVGDSDFTAVGALANQVGDLFTATATGAGTGTVAWAEVDETDVNILEVPDATTIVYRQTGADVTGTVASGFIKWAPDLFLVNSQDFLNNMVFKGLAAPAYCINIDSDAIVDTSPYVQNCSNINGPWMRNGVEWLPFITEQPDLLGNPVTGPRPLLDSEIDPAQVHIYGIDTEGSGGGMLIDGDRYSSESPIKSMVADAFTQVAQGSIGFHITNFGYMQLVSCFAVFCKKAFYTTRGGYLSISNSVIDFGEEGFVAEGYYPDPYGSGLVTSNYYSSVASVTATPGQGYDSEPTVLIAPPTTPGGVQATAVASIDPILGVVNAITIVDQGSGYDFQPSVTISGGGATVDATGIANLQKNQYIDVFELSNKPQIGSVMFLGNDTQSYYVTDVTNPSFTFKYDEQKCRRDVGIILDAVLADMLFGSTYRSVHAGLSYLRSYSSKVTSLQKAQTIAGLTEAKNQALLLTSNPTAQTRITTGFNTVINIINFGISVVPSIVNPTPPTYEAGFPEAAAILLANKTFIQNDIVNWIADNYSMLSYNEATCRRDVGYIVDSMCYDLIYGGNSQTINAALSYKEGSVIAGEVEETQAAYEYWKSIVGNIVKNIPVVTTTVGQNTSLPLGSPTNPNAPKETAESLLQIIIDVLDNGPGYIPENPTPPTYTNGGLTLLTERNNILDSSLTIQEQVIDYLNNLYGGSSRVYTFPAITSVALGVEPRFYNVSTVSTGGTALEYVGAGVTYNALPFFGGEPIPARERVERESGKCFTVSNDQVGNFRVGEFFTVNALTGEVTIDAEKLNLSGLASIGPFRRNGVPVGVQLREVSNNANLIASNGVADPNTVPTQPAVQTYVENRYLNKVGTSAQTVTAPITFTNDIGVNGGDLYSTATTFNLLNRDGSGSISEDGPTTVNAFLNAGTINIAHTTSTTTINGNLEVKGAIVSTTQTSVDLLNTNTTTVNAFGAATTINVGDTTGTVTFKNATITFPNATQFNINGVNPTVASTSTGTLTLFDTLITTVNAFRAATAINIGESSGTLTINSANTVVNGDLQVKGGDITTNQTTFNLLNTTATTVNAFGAATTLNLAAGSGTTTINNNLQANLNSTLGLDTTSSNILWGILTANIRDNNSNSLEIKEATNSYFKIDTSNSNELTSFGTIAKVAFNNVTDASSTTVASTAFAGGVGIAKKLYVGTDLNVAGNATLGDDRTADTHTVSGTLSVNVPDNTAIAFQIKENTQTYITAITTDNSESITIEATPKLLVKNITDSTDKDTGAVIIEGGVGIEKNLNVGVDLGVGRDATITGDLSVNGGDIATTAVTANLLNTNATTVNFAGVATDIQIGAATGTTNINNNLDVDGDVNIDGGDLTVSATTFNLANTNATIVNFAGAATTINIGFADVGALTTIKHDLKVDGGLAVDGALTLGDDVNITGDLSVNGGDLTTTATTFNLINANAATVNFAGAATDIQIGAATGTTNINNDLDVDGDINFDGGDITSSAVTVNILAAISTTVNAFGAATALNLGATSGTTIVKNNFEVDLNTVLNGTLQVDSNATIVGDLEVRGGDLTTNQTTFNLLNTNATTVNAFGVATGINLGTSAAAASTLTYGPAITGNTFKLASTTGGTANFTTDVTGGILNLFGSVSGTTNLSNAGTINLGKSASLTTSVVVGGNITGNSLKIAGTAAGTVTVSSDVTTGSVNLFNNITTGTLNVAGAGASTINLGSTTSTVNIGVLTLTTDLAVQYGGTGQSSFTTNGIIYGQNTSGLAVTAASVPGSNAITSYGILTTDASNVPVWTDTIDGGSY